jgi:hypothetical protein
LVSCRGTSPRAADRLPGPQAGDQLGHGEGLGQVVVGAEQQPLDPVLDRGRGGEHEDPGHGPLGHQLPADGVAVDRGDVAVEDDDVVVDLPRLVQRGGAVAHGVDREGVAPQPPGDHVGQLFVVLDHQYTHCRGPPSPPAL